VPSTPWHRGGMKIEVDGSPATKVLIFLTESEARELRDGLEDLLGNLGSRDWHTHVSSADFSTEITLVPETGACVPAIVIASVMRPGWGEVHRVAWMRALPSAPRLSRLAHCE